MADPVMPLAPVIKAYFGHSDADEFVIKMMFVWRATEHEPRTTQLFFIILHVAITYPRSVVDQTSVSHDNAQQRIGTSADPTFPLCVEPDMGNVVY